LRLDLALGDRHDAGLGRTAIKPEGSQLGIVGMGREHHDAPAGVVRIALHVQYAFASNAAESRAQLERTGHERLALPRQVQVATPRHPALEGLLVVTDQHVRIEQTA